MKKLDIFVFPLAATVPFAQPAPVKPAFETAAIRLTPPDAQCGMIQPMPGGGLRVDCLSFRTILTWAYAVQDYQISGGPPWTTSARWSILAKAAASESPENGPADYSKMTDAQRERYMDLVRQRLQTLLADRFQLTLRRETLEQTVYALTVAKNGPKLKESTDQSAAGFLKRGRGQITAMGAQLGTLAQFLAIDVRRLVTDRTGLTGHYDFKLEWTLDTPAGPESNDPNGPSLFTALQEQLGLRLESQKGPVDVLVIDRVEKPSEN